MKTSRKLNNKGIDVLVVEDSLTQAEELKYLLNKSHYLVRTASNGKEAVAQIKKQKPMLIISDIMMPEMDGYELCRYVKKNESLESIPVLLLTSLSDPQDIIRGLESGADNFVVKPYDENYLMSRIDYIISNQFLQKKERLEIGVEIFFAGKRYFINSQKRQILDLLISTYETAVIKNEELKKAQKELRELNESLEKKVEERTALLKMEIEVRKEAEEKVIRFNRVYEILSSINKTIVHVRELDKLFNEACRTAVEIGLYSMVWIGLVDEKDNSIKPAAWKGDTKGYIEDLVISLDKDEAELGTIGKAVKGNHCVVSNDIENDESMRIRHHRALKKNFRSVLSFPLEKNGKAVGAISFYSCQKNFFDEQEIKLLEELAMDLSFAAYAIEQEKLRQITEAELIKSDKRLRMALSATTTGIWEWNAQINEVYWSKECFEIMGVIITENKIDNFLNYIHPDDLNMVNEAIQKSIAEKAFLDVDFRIISPDGKTIWLHDKGKTEYDDLGKPLRMIGTVSNITEQKSAFEKIKLLAQALESINECVRITDLDDHLTYVNNAFCKVYGFDKESLIGKHVSIVRSENNPSSLENKILPKTLEGGWQGELLNKRCSGEEFYAYLSTSVILNEKGETTALMGISSDITERKNFENNLRKLSRAVEQSPISIIITDLLGNIEYVNPKFTQVTGYTFDEVKGQNPRILKLGKTTDGEYNFLWTEITSGNVWTGEFLNKKKDGSVFWEAANISPIKNPDGLITNFIAVKEDITLRKKAEEELISAKEKAEEMNRLKSSFLANMSHELRTPMIGILGFSEILSKEVKDPEQAEMVETINSSGKRLLNTLNLLLDLSRIEANREEIKFQKININEAVLPIIKTYESVAKRKSLLLNYEISDKNITANLDVRIFEQVLNNLIINALKFTSQGSVSVKINLEKVKTNSMIVIKVIDTGIGIPSDHLLLIFEEFRQASEGLNRSYEGTGLGLTIAKKSVELLGGSISVRSEVGVGSTFTVCFPIGNLE